GADQLVTAILKKELLIYFGSFLFYVLGCIFLVLCGFFFYTNLDFFVRFGGMNLPLGLWQYQFFDMRQLLLALVPLLTMRLFAEERRLGTLELLWTYPVRDAAIIAGKFGACMLVVGVMIVATMVYPVVLGVYYPVAAGPVVAGYVGLWLLATAFVAAGLFLSALTGSPLGAGASTHRPPLLFLVPPRDRAAGDRRAPPPPAPLSPFH